MYIILISKCKLYQKEIVVSFYVFLGFLNLAIHLKKRGFALLIHSAKGNSTVLRKKKTNKQKEKET